MTWSFCLNALAQTNVPASQEKKIATTLEAQGDLEGAKKLFETIYNRMPENPIANRDYARILEKLRLFDEWLAITKIRIDKNPQDIQSTGELGRIYYLKGDEAQAQAVWNGIIEKEPENQGNYRQVSYFFQRARLYDDAIEILLVAREKFKQPQLFANQLANMYQYRRNYGMAVTEWLNMVSGDKRYFQMVERTINNYPETEDVVSEVTAALERSVGSDTTSQMLFMNLLGGFQIKNGNYDKAFETYKTIDRSLKTGGAELVKFANQIYTIGHYITAIEVYEHILSAHPLQRNSPIVKMGLARSYEMSGFSEIDSDSAGAALQELHRGRAVEEYNKIALEFKGRPESAEANFRLGEINFIHLFDPDKAIENFNLVRQSSRNSYFRYDATLRVGDCYIAKGNLIQSSNYFRSLMNSRGQYITYKLRAQYKLIMNEYYAGNIDTTAVRAAQLLGEIPFDHDMTNELIDLTMFIDENRKDASFKQYANAEFLVLQNKQSEAVAFLSAIVDKGNDQELADDALLLRAEILSEMKQFDGALESYRALINDFPESQQAETALYSAGMIYEEQLERPADAMSMYEEFLRRFGMSIHVETVRTRLRNLQSKLSGNN